MQDDLIELDLADKIAEGGERYVFVHPDDPRRLIKVLKPRQASEFPEFSFGHLTQRFIPAARWRATVKQYDEYNRLMLGRLFDPQFDLPISHLYGFVKTNLGLGCICERITDAAGGNAPTLKQLIQRDQFGPAQLEQFNAYIRRLYEVSVCVGDVSAANFVFGQRHCGPAAAVAPPEWVMVDGFGDRFAITIRSISRRVRSLGLDDNFKRRYRRPERLKGLTWNPGQRRFELPG